MRRVTLTLNYVLLAYIGLIYFGDISALAARENNHDSLESTTLKKREAPARNDMILVHITNTGAAPRVVQPQLTVDTNTHFDFRIGAQQVVVNHHETITASSV